MHASELDTPRRSSPAMGLALVLLIALALGGWQALVQVRIAPGTVLPAGTWAARQAAHGNNALPMDSVAPTAGPGWGDLTAAQKQALRPLSERWPFLSELQKRRWLALAQSFTSLPPAEQGKLHERMAEWASLSAQQRNQARLNFATANKLAPDNKRAQWEAYQALSEETKHRLAAGAGPQSTGAATALRPVPARKLAQIPAATALNANPLNPPKIPPLSAGTQHLRPVAPVPVPDARLPMVDPMTVETAPVSVPIAEPQPLPPLPTDPAAPSSADSPPQH